MKLNNPTTKQKRNKEIRDKDKYKNCRFRKNGYCNICGEDCGESTIFCADYKSKKPMTTKKPQVNNWEDKLLKILKQHYKKDQFQNKWTILRDFISQTIESEKKAERERIIEMIDEEFEKMCHLTELKECKYWKSKAFGYEEDDRTVAGDKFFPDEVKERIIKRLKPKP